jgi:HK97 gp10 family phage protein
MSMSVNIAGIKGLQKAFSSYSKTKTEELRDATNSASLNVDREAKRNAPVDTGRLRASIHAVPANTFDSETNERTGDLEALVTTNVTYAPFMEHGTFRLSPRPFMFPAWEAERPKYIAEVKKILARI